MWYKYSEKNNNPWKLIKKYIDADGCKYVDYYLNGSHNDGIATIELNNKLGYRFRNIWVDKSLQRQGFATIIHDKMNIESIQNTGKPLRSSDIGYEHETTTSPEGQSFLESLVSKNKAKRIDDHYEFEIPIEIIDKNKFQNWLKKAQIKEKEPWEMSSQEFHDFIYSLERKERLKYISLPTHRIIKERAGETPENIIEYYQNKYELPKIPITRNASENPCHLIVWYDKNTDEITRWSLNITPDIETKWSKAWPLLLRHEIEHAIDIYGGFRPTPSAVQLPDGTWSTEGHHKRFPQFETGYPHRQSVKDAMEQGLIGDGIRDYPDLQDKLKNVV
jgi:hypothetical protein